MSRAKKKPESKAKKGISRSTIALVVLWAATAVLVSAALWVRPAAGIRLELTATTLGFTLAGQSSQLLLRATPAESLTIAGFSRLEPRPPGAGGAAVQPLTAADAGASLTVSPGDLEGVSVAGQALVRINRPEDEPGTRITIAHRQASGTVRLPAQSDVRCYRCGADDLAAWLVRGAADSRAVSSFTWSGGGEGGGTDLLLRTAGPLVLSEDDVRIEGTLETRATAGEQLVSTLRAGTLQFLDIPRTTPLGDGVRLTVADIQPGTGLLKRLEVGPKGVTATLEARVGSLSIEQAGQVTPLLPSYLEIGFHNQRWLYLVQGIVLVGGTLSKIWTALKGSKEA